MDTLVGAVPDHWLVHPLSNLCIIQSGPSGSVTRNVGKAAPGAGVPMISAQSIGELTIDGDRLDWVDPNGAARLERFRLSPDDILITRIGTRPRQALVGAEYGGALQGGSCLRLRSGQGLLPEYLSGYLEHPRIREWITRHMGRTVVPTLSASAIGRLPVALPPDLAEQRRAVQAIRRVDQQIQAHRDVVREGLALRQALLAALWSGQDPNRPVQG